MSSELFHYADQELSDGGSYCIEVYNGETPRGEDPILVASYGDINRAARKSGRKILHMEHGTGHAFDKPAYPNGRGGKRDLVSLFLAPNAYTASLIRMTRPTRCEVIGTPKMDPWVQGVDPSILLSRPKNNPPVIAIAFHWGDRHAKPPESGSAWEHYKDILPALQRNSYHLIGHGHPLATDVYREEFERLGIEWVANFRDVLKRADLYINDLSSTLYEFLLTGKPVIVLNAPWFRREVYWGIRFWDYSDVGINVEHPDQLIPAIDQTLADYGSVCAAGRRRAIKDLYPYAGYAAQRAAKVIIEYLEQLEKAEHVHIAK